MLWSCCTRKRLFQQFPKLFFGDPSCPWITAQNGQMLKVIILVEAAAAVVLVTVSSCVIIVIIIITCGVKAQQTPPPCCALRRHILELTRNVIMVTPHLPWKFHANRSSCFLVILVTKKQTERNEQRNGSKTIPGPRYYRGQMEMLQTNN